MKLNRQGLAFVHLGLALALISLYPAPVWSQATSAATLAGVVTDEQGAAVPGAEVRIVDVDTSGTQTTLSNETSRYVFANVTPGTYSVTITKQGFTTYKINAQKVDIGTVVTLNAPLKVGATSTTIEVTAASGVDLQTTNAAVG